MSFCGRLSVFDVRHVLVLFCGRLHYDDFLGLTAMVLQMTTEQVTITMHRAKILQYAQGLSTSMNVSASLNCGVLLNMSAIVLFAQCMSIVSFNEPVL